MIKTEAQERKMREDLFLIYLKGIRENAVKDEQIAWERYMAVDKTDLTELSSAYIKYARSAGKAATLDQVISAYCDQVRRGMTI